MIGRQFKDARESLGLSQDELAEVLGLSGKQAVSNIETGLRNPSTLVAAVLLLLTELPEKKSQEVRAALRDTVAKISRSKRRVR